MRRAVLSADQIDQFIDRGYVHLPEAFPRERALAAQNFLWEKLAQRGVKKDDRATWTQPMVNIQEVYTDPVFAACSTERLLGATDDLLGVDRRKPGNDAGSWGWWPVNFAMGADKPWDVPAEGWHWDGIHFRHSIDAPNQGLLFLCVFSSNGEHGGVTTIAAGSHRIVARYLASLEDGRAGGAGLVLQDAIRGCIPTHPWLADLSGKPLDGLDGADDPAFLAWRNSGDRIERFMRRSFVDRHGAALNVVEAVGEPGDAYLCHPMMFHAPSANHRGVPRFMCNRTVALKERLQFDRANDADYSPLERSIRMAIKD